MITYNNNVVNDERFYIEAIKLSVSSVQYKHLSVKNLLIASVEQLFLFYQQFEKKEYLDTALLQIQAYLELGFPYEGGKDIFDNILQALDIKKELQFPRKLFPSKEIALKKSEVRSMIKKWPASSRQNMKISEVVDDIIRKVSEQEIGIHYYKNVVTEELYELIINEYETIFHDLQRNIFYTFRK